MILVCAPISLHSLSWLKKNTSQDIVQCENSPSLEQWNQARALIVRTNTTINIDTFKHASKLELIVTATSGFDHIDLQACKDKGVTVAHCPAANTIAAAEQSLHLILATLKNANQVRNALKKNLWKNHLPFSQELTGKNIGLLGFGRVARRLTKMLNGFDCNIAAHDPYLEHSEVKNAVPGANVQPMGRTELFRWADILSLHLPLTRKTKQLINRNTLEQMNSDTILINCSRGEVLNEDDVVQWLQQGELRSVGLDVFAVEPLPEKSKLRQFPQVYLSPHIGGYTEEARQRASQEAVETVVQFFNRETLSASLPPDSGWAKDL